MRSRHGSENPASALKRRSGVRARLSISPLITLALALSVARAAEAVPIPGLFNTGVDDSNLLLADGAIDPHYALVSSPSPGGAVGPNAFVASPRPPTYIENGPDSKWLGPGSDGTADYPDGSYTWRITFDLTGLDAQSAMIAGEWSSDNGGLDILINGNSLGFATANNQFALGFAPFTITAGFVAGVNTLDFVVNNEPFASGNNPTGVRVRFTSSSAVPEPGTLGLLAFGVAGIAVLRPRSRCRRPR